MARPSKLTPGQRDELMRRRDAGESAAALAREYGVSETMVSRMVSQVSQFQVSQVANQLVEARRAVAALPLADQHRAMTMADRLMEINKGLAEIAVNGIKTSKRLSEIAAKQAMQVDERDPMESAEKLQAIAALTKIANEASQTGLKLAIANQQQNTISMGAVESAPVRRIEIVAMTNDDKSNRTAA